MLKKNFIRLNINDNYLSLGNLFRILKEESVNPNSFWQSDLFCVVFNTENIADSTVNNYCTGLRAINLKYKNYYMNLREKFTKNKNVLLPTVTEILEIVNDNSYNPSSITLTKINKDTRMHSICSRLYSISKNDSDVSNKLSKILYKYLSNNDLYYFVTWDLKHTYFNIQTPGKEIHPFN